MNKNPHSCDKNDNACRDANRDPLSNEPGAHPVGTGVGAALGGAAAGAATGIGAGMAAGALAGAAAGNVAGPVGTVVGTIVGGVVGGIAGKQVAENIDPTREDAYWREHFSTRPYAERDSAYDTYRPAYQYGWEARGKFPDRQFDDVEPELERDWPKSQGKSSMSWSKAKPATRDAWEHIK